MSRRAAPPVTPPRKRHRTTPRCLSRWLVVSGDYQEFYSQGLEPPEWGRAVVYVDAWTRRDAIHAACRTPDFDAWVTMRRGDHQCPYGGVTAERLHAVLP